MHHHFQRFIRDTDGAVTINMTVLAAAIVGIGLTSVAAVTVGVTDLGSKFENGVTNAGTVVLCMFSNQNDCAGNGGGDEEEGEDEDGGEDTVIGNQVISHDVTSLRPRNAEQLERELRLMSADDLEAYAREMNDRIYSAISNENLVNAGNRLDRLYIALTVLADRYGYERVAETYAAEFNRAAAFYEQNLARQGDDGRTDPYIPDEDRLGSGITLEGLEEDIRNPSR